MSRSRLTNKYELKLERGFLDLNEMLFQLTLTKHEVCKMITEL